MRKPLAILAVVLAATAAAYLPALDGAFVLDDGLTLRETLRGSPLDAGAASWLPPARPVAAFTFWLDHAAVGLAPRGWHLTNLAIHLAAVALAWLLARAVLARAGLERPEGAALSAAALFALHPLQSEAVAYVTQRAESLASALYLAGLLLLVAWDGGGGRRRRGALAAGATALFLLGLATKPIVATLPAAWLLLAAVLPPPAEADLPAWRRVARRLPAALPMLVLAGAGALFAMRATAGSTHAGLDVPGLPPHLYLATQLRVVPTYLRLLLWPAGQCGDWSFPASGSFLEPGVLAGGAFLAALVAAALAGARRLRGSTGDAAAAGRTAAFGILFFLLVLAPSSSVVPLLDPLAEHRVYLASLGVFLAAAAGATAALRRIAPARAALAGAALTAAVAAGAGIATAARAEVWATPLAFWSDAAARTPAKARAHMNLAVEQLAAGRPAEALENVRAARALMGDHTVDRVQVLWNLVAALLTLGRVDEARAELTAVLARAPRDPVALGALASVEYAAGRDEEAERAAQAALAAAPGDADALRSLGMARLRRGDAAGARDAAGAAVRADPSDAMSQLVLGQAEEALGDLRGACGTFARAAGLQESPLAARQARAALSRLGCR